MKQIRTLSYLIALLITSFTTLHVKAQGPGVYVAGQQGPSGGTGGNFCNTYTAYSAYDISSITIRSGAYIDAVTLSFNAGKADPAPLTCGGPGGSPRTITLRPGEYIVRVMGKYDRFVEYLYIQTAGVTDPQYAEFGNNQTTAKGYFDFQAVAGTKIGNFVVKSGQYVDAIGVVIKKQ